jgi:hypothetical protein
MKERTFEVPEDKMAEFASIIENALLPNSIQGTTEDDDIIVTVQYDEKRRLAVFDLMELLDPEEDD